MPNSHDFEHLTLIRREEGPARFNRPNFQIADQTRANSADRPKHSAHLNDQVVSVSTYWSNEKQKRQDDDLPAVGDGIPLLLQIDPSYDIDGLKHFFGFEIVSEQDDGYVIVASPDKSLSYFQQKLVDFVGSTKGPIRGSAGIASIHELEADLSQEDRLRRILSETLFADLPNLNGDTPYIVDVSISCQGKIELPKKPKRGRMLDKTWARKEAEWSEDRARAYDQWDVIKDERMETIQEFISFYQGEILSDTAPNSDAPPDYFELRLRLPARGLRDLLLNHPYIFEAVEPEDIELPQRHARQLEEIGTQLTLNSPAADAPRVCVIDSGIQEEHVLLDPAIEKDRSYCFLPGVSHSDVADYVTNGGHGTRVAGAVLYGNSIPTSGSQDLEFWIQNARVLDGHCRMPVALLPPALIRQVVTHFRTGPLQTRIFNHSINADAPCRQKHMSAWAAEIDRLSNEHDILVIQSVGNLQITNPVPKPGVTELLHGGKDYPGYFTEACCRLANPAQSFQALTVGSVTNGIYESGGWRSFGTQLGEPSAFSRSGLGIWQSLKPEVVEFGGDFLRTPGATPSVSAPSLAKTCYPSLVRSTMGGGPAFDRDDVGTSYAAPMVTRIAARLESILPEASCLLYRGLIVQSAHWPDWANSLQANEKAALITRIGYGVPDMERATMNDDYRTTFITEQEQQIKQGECHVYQVPVPAEVRAAGTDYSIRVDVTLSYAAEPRRTRMGHRGYLSTWADWLSNRRDEPLESFISRAVKDDEDAIREGVSLPWMIHARSSDGQIPNDRRNIGTVQKDWAIIKSNQLPEDFCVAVRGHKGWSTDPDNVANYTLVVTFEIVGQEIPIYDPFRIAVEDLKVELGIGELEAEVSV